MRRIALALIMTSAPAFAGESTIVLSDNTTIKSVELYGNPEFEVETVELNDPASDAECFDNAKTRLSRTDRYSSIDDCLNYSVIGVPA